MKILLFGCCILFHLFSSLNLSAQNNCRVPANVMVNKATTNTATVSWDRTNNAYQYVVRYRLTTDVNWLTQTATDTFMVLNGLAIDKAYECQVQSICNQNRQSGFSKSVWFNTASVWNQTATGDLFLANPNAQIGIGSVPSAKLHVLGGALFEGSSGMTPISGAGTRMMWIPVKSALRAGTVSGNQWDDANVGIGSVALGENALASGTNGFALGKNTISSGVDAFAIGTQTQATGLKSFAYGYGVQATAPNAFALGIGQLDDLGNLVAPAINIEPNTFVFFNGSQEPALKLKPSNLEDWGIEPQGGGGGGNPCTNVKITDNTFFGNIVIKQALGTNNLPCGGGHLCMDGRFSADRIHTNRGVFFSRACSSIPEDDYRITTGSNNLLFSKTDVEYLRFTETKRVGILESSPDEPIHLGATTKIQRSVTGGSSYNMIINTKGTNADFVNQTKALSIYREISGHLEQDRTVLYSNGNADFKGNVDIGINNTNNSRGLLNVTGDKGWLEDRPAVYTETLVRFQDKFGRPLFNLNKAGCVGIGTDILPNNLDVKLLVNGTICMKEGWVRLDGSPCWPDYIFEKGYVVPSLDSVEQYIRTHKHLPEIPTAKDVESNGFMIGETQRAMLKNMEEMYLQMIELHKRVKSLEAENKALKEKVGK